MCLFVLRYAITALLPQRIDTANQVILSIDNSPSKPEVEIIARISPEAILPRKDGTPATEDDPRTVVALRQGHLMLTTYHPELTKDNRFHEYFLLEVVTPFIAGRDKEE